MELHITDKLALVTGSTGGIGLAIGSALASEGATVMINGRSEKRVAEAIGKIREKLPHAKLEPLIGDLSTVEAVKQAISAFPHFDILINNLACMSQSLSRLFQMRTEWRSLKQIS